MDEQDRSTWVGIMYVGNFASVSARFPERGLSLYFERSVPKLVPPDQAALFEPSHDWVVGVTSKEMHEAGPGPKHVLVRRAVALGDVLCVHGALQGILRAYPRQYRLSYQVSEIYADIFRPHPAYVHVLGTDTPLYSVGGLDHVVSLDGLLEKDHNVDADKVNRVVRTWRHFFGQRGDLMDNPNLKPDFRLTIPETDRAWAFRKLEAFGLLDGKPLVAVAARAVQNPRNVQDGLVRAFTDDLTRRTDCRVLLLEPEHKHIWTADRVYSFPQSTVLQAMALLQHADVLCTMDSGAMWMGHCIPVPMVVWLGPTPPETKCNYHAFYPEGVRALRMWEWIGCPAACYEAATWCDWSYRCVKQPPRERFIEESIAAVLELVDWNRTHGQKARQPGILAIE